MEKFEFPLTQHDVAIGSVETVNARDLHKTLKVGRDFSNWIKSRLPDVHKDEDYVVVENWSSPNPANPLARPQKRIDYYLTIETAKHVAMMERNELGYSVRQYFIDFEKAQKQAQNMPGSYVAALRAHLAAVEQAEALEQARKEAEAKLLEQAPKVEYAERSIAANGSITMKKFASLVLGKHYGRLISDQYVLGALRAIKLVGKGTNGASINMPLNSCPLSTALFEYKNPDTTGMSEEEFAARKAANPHFNSACTHIKPQFVDLLLELFTHHLIDEIKYTPVRAIDKLVMEIPEWFREKVKKVNALTIV